MGRHSARRRRGPVALVTGAAAVLATGAFATTLADGGQEPPRTAAAPREAPTTVEPASAPATDRGEDLNRASRTFRRTPAPDAVTDASAAAPATPSGTTTVGPSSTPSASPSASATRSPARTGTPRPTSTPSSTRTPGPPSPSPSPTPSVTTTPTGSLLDVVPGIVGGLVR